MARWARALGGLDADVDDLTQEVFWVVRRKLPGFDGRNLHAWLYRIAQRTVRDYRRRAWFRRVSFGRPDPLPWDNTAAPKETSDPSDQLERQEAEQILAELLSKMSEMRRTVFVLFEIEGYSGKEIAELQGVPLNTVWTRLHHARRDFTRLIEVARKEGRVS